MHAPQRGLSRACAAQVFGAAFDALRAAEPTREGGAALPGFGASRAAWRETEHFYSRWGSFATARALLAGGLDPRAAENRWERRRVDEANRKLSAQARRAFSAQAPPRPCPPDPRGGLPQHPRRV